MSNRFTMRRNALLLASSVTAMLQIAGTTLARADGASAPDNVLETVVVTAQRHSENQQNVPIAITTLTASNLKSGSINTTEDLTAVTPGLTFTQQINDSTPYIRGVGQNSGVATNENSVATYVDGVYYMFPGANMFSFNNISQIEVLKGPQGTLFGRNATGGLINIITRDPQMDPEYDISSSYGSYGIYQGSLYATAGVDDVAADIAVNTIKQGQGFGHNVITGQDINIQDEESLRSKVVWTPTSKDKLTFEAGWSNNNSDTGTQINAYPGSVLLDGQSASGTVWDSRGDPGYHHELTWDSSIHYERDLDWAQFSFMSAYQYFKQNSGFDVDNTPIPLLYVVVPDYGKSFQNEFILHGVAGRLDWTAGTFFLFAQQGDAPTQQISAIIDELNYKYYTRQTTESEAMFFQGTYQVADGTNLTAGIRGTVDQRSFAATEYATQGNPAPVGSLLLAENATVQYPELTWRLALNHQFDDGLMAYISYNRGFKSGLFAGSNLTQPPIKPEVLDAFEVGVKSEFFDHTFRLNADVFYYDYKNIQLSQVLGQQDLLLNAASARPSGGEIEMTWAPQIGFGDLVIDAGTSFMFNDTYARFPNAPSTVPTPGGGNTLVSINASGNQLIDSPKWTADINANYSFPIGTGKGGLNVTYFHSDGFYWEANNRLTQPAYNLLNLEVSYSFGMDYKYRVRVYGQNALDNVYYTLASSSPFGDQETAAPPATFGVGFDIRL